MLEKIHQNRLFTVSLHAKIQTSIASISRYSKSMNLETRLALRHLGYDLRIRIVLYMKFSTSNRMVSSAINDKFDEW